MRYFFSSIFLLLVSHGANAQRPAVIIGNTDSIPDSTVIYIYPLIGNLPVTFYQKPGAIVTHNKFIIKSDQITDGIIKIESKIFKADLYAVPGDTTFIKIKGNSKPVFSGRWQHVDQLLNDGHFTDGPIMDVKVGDILLKEQDSKVAFEKLNLLLSVYKKPVDSLLEKGYTSSNVHNKLSLFKESNFLFITFGELISFYNDDKKGISTSKLDSTFIKELFGLLYEKYQPLDEKYLCSPSFSVMLSNTCSAISFGFLKRESRNRNEWEKFSAHSGYHSFAPVKLQEYAMASSLTTIYKYFNHDIESQANIFNTLFPNSPYAPIFNKWVAEERIAHLTHNDPTTELITFSSAKDSLLITKIPAAKAIQAFIQERFPGQAVFVDCWATWCSPCKEEFRYADKLHTFLHNNNIGMLYISMDRKSSEESWHQNIHEYTLHGTHITASDSLSKNIRGLLGVETIGLPRYLLFDNRGIMVESNALRPSTEEKLFKQIAQKLQLN